MLRVKCLQPRESKSQQQVGFRMIDVVLVLGKYEKKNLSGMKKKVTSRNK